MNYNLMSSATFGFINPSISYKITAMMKRLYFVFAAAAILTLGACSTSKLAQNNDDDVYYAKAKAKEVPQYVAQKKEPTYRTDEQLYADSSSYDRRDEYASNNYDYNNYDYSTRINRFYRYSPYRSYYDPYYSYRYDPWYDYSYRPGVSIYLGYNSPRYWNENYYWIYGYNSPNYYNNYWGTYSYYNSYPGYYGNNGYYGNGNYYGGYSNSGRDYSSPNYRPRPNREGYSSNGQIYTPNSQPGNNNIPNRPSRTGINPGYSQPADRVTTQGGSTINTQPESRPVRPSRESVSQPAPVQQQSRPEPTYSRPERNSYPTQSQPAPSSSGSNSSGNSNGGSSSGGSSSGGSRPSRGGR